MDNKNLFKEAIADAKAVREAALANAKAALEEALTPKLQSMLAAKLNEMDYDSEVNDLEDAAEEVEEGFNTEEFGFDDEDNTSIGESEDALEEDFDLSEILAELEDDENLSEAKKEKEEEDKKKKKKMMKEAEEEAEEEESEDVADMSVEDLKALIKDIVAQEMGNEEGGEEAGEEIEMGGEEESDEINLDELLAELDALGEGEDKDEMEEGILGKIGGAIKKGAQAVNYATGGNPKDCIERGDKIVATAKARAEQEGKTLSPAQYTQLRDMEINVCRKEKGLSPLVSYTGPGTLASRYEAQEMKEAISVINTLRSELNEVNLLNAKLLYVNKIFKAKNLSESQKLKVIASFDKATTAKEAKVVFESLSANLTAAPKQAIKESMGFASRAAGTAPRKAIVETNDAITRMQKLANIIK
jgi:hypothetical protein